MLFVLLAILLSLMISALVALYVAYPGRGEPMPIAPWLGEAMEKAAEAAPTLDDDERDLLRLR